MAETSDVLVIGAGPGGYVAATRAAELRMEVTIVEKKPSWRCLPQLGLHSSQGAAHHG
jgi:dihydrolipoamide dehydrogenase